MCLKSLITKFSDTNWMLSAANKYQLWTKLMLLAVGDPAMKVIDFGL